VWRLWASSGSVPFGKYQLSYLQLAVTHKSQGLHFFTIPSTVKELALQDTNAVIVEQWWATSSSSAPSPSSSSAPSSSSSPTQHQQLYCNNTTKQLGRIHHSTAMQNLHAHVYYEYVSTTTLCRKQDIRTNTICTVLKIPYWILCHMKAL